MTRVVPFAVALLLLGTSAAWADIPPLPRPPNLPSPSSPPPPAPPPEPMPSNPKPDIGSTGCGLGLTASVVLAGVWLLRSRRRPALQQS